MLANDTYWLTHDDFRGEPRTSERSAGFMVAAGLMGELIHQNAVGVSEGRVVALASSSDELGSQVVRQISVEQRRYSIEVWLECLAADMCTRVGRRMVSAGAARPRRNGVSWRRAVVANAGDTGPAWVYAGLVNAVRYGQPLSEYQRFLLYLAQASSIGRRFFDGVEVRRVHYARQQITAVWPGWRDLLDATVKFVHDGAMTR